MRLLYVFPHPDDESFGPALAIVRQRREGHFVHLLTLTRGGATKQRHRLGLGIDEMGLVRRREMDCVASVLDLASMDVLDLPDGRLAEVEGATLRAVVRDAFHRCDPDVVVTYASHGVSGHPDHVRTHHIVSSVFDDVSERNGRPARLAFFTLLPIEPTDELCTSTPDEVDCAVQVDETDVATTSRALACYASYAETIREKDPIARVGRVVYFDVYGEEHDPWLNDLTAGIQGAR